jgi:hypothetical protein
MSGRFLGELRPGLYTLIHIEFLRTAFMGASRRSPLPCESTGVRSTASPSVRKLEPDDA